jgi:hydrogenase/urease accessory protein HupE
MAGLFLFAGFTTNAQAHLAIKGLDEFGNGALHPFITPAHALIVVALGLLIGQQVPLTLKAPIIALASASAAALLFTATGWVSWIYQPILIGLALGIAVLVAVEVKLPRNVLAAVCALGVAGICLDSRAESGTTLAVTKTLLGTWLSLNLAVPYLAICASNGTDRPWARTAIRVVGSWIVAISLMVLAFAFRK